jgi:cytochrome b
MAKYVYEGHDDIFVTPDGITLYAQGEAVELTAEQAAFVRRYPYGRHLLREVSDADADARVGENPTELVILHEGQAMIPETPSTSGSGVMASESEPAPAEAPSHQQLRKREAMNQDPEKNAQA